MNMLWNALEQSCLEHAYRPALSDQAGNVISYGELLGRVRARANLLRSLLSTGSRVAVLEEYPLEEAIEILALLSLNVTIVPLYKRYGIQRCEQILGHTRPHYLLSKLAASELELLEQTCEAVGTTLLSPHLGDLVQQNPGKEKLGDTEQPLPPSFLMYTSGSTGKPKGAILTYANIWANIVDIRAYFDINKKDHILINRSLSHASVMTGEFLLGLMCGAQLTFYTEAFMPRRLLSFMEKTGITVFGTTPTIFYQLACDKANYSLPQLSKVSLMGEYMHKQVASKAKERFPHVEFYMLYGQTEASPRITYLPSEHFSQKEGCIGKPLLSMKIRIVDNQGVDTCEGEVGQLLVQGPNVFYGYWDAPELTSAKLKDGWLHTGDAIYQGTDGYLYIAGRQDDMIIRAGMNIYPKEIEDRLLEDERIREVIVFSAMNPKYGQSIQMAVVAESDALLTQADVMAICKKKLASYQYPDEIQIVEAIPRNHAGKIVRKPINYAQTLI
ncbi:acyl--CoA ligase [Paenibacillus sp. SYP-B3998]|uniref:Acyl--CoA ligase n=1 Tax=Paenibacillus sp. SYP-B3998 TaxID=2678564 RepID=A0A6G3ZXX9_9BACL|nr:class I adenylate-forming enzyme family protein [Paenibacillus sp. SYP-B3998]NEW06267.1 acyl--CoA ligase [Paenibacillus sp. SYP-B3998]